MGSAEAGDSGLARMRAVLSQGSFTHDTRFGGEGPLARRIALQTTIYLDGDVLTRVDPRALERSDFEQLRARHYDDLLELVERTHETSSRYLEWLHRIVGLLVPLGYAGARGVGLGPLTDIHILLGSAQAELLSEALNLGLAGVGGVIAAALVQRGLSGWLTSPGRARSVYRQS